MQRPGQTPVRSNTAADLDRSLAVYDAQRVKYLDRKNCGAHEHSRVRSLKYSQGVG